MQFSEETHEMWYATSEIMYIFFEQNASPSYTKWIPVHCHYVNFNIAYMQFFGTLSALKFVYVWIFFSDDKISVSRKKKAFWQQQREQKNVFYFLYR